MPTAVSIALILASACVVLMAILVAAISLKVSKRLEAMESNISKLNADVTALVKEGRAVVAQTTQVLAKVEAQMEDVQYITSTARNWVTKADGAAEVVGKIAEPALMLVSKKMQFARAFLGGVLQSFTNHKQQ